MRENEISKLESNVLSSAKSNYTAPFQNILQIDASENNPRAANPTSHNVNFER